MDLLHVFRIILTMESPRKRDLRFVRFGKEGMASGLRS